MARVDPGIGLLLEILDQAYDQKAWHGTTLRGSLRGVSPHEALWRPKPKRHSVWELALHAGYWKYAVRRQLLGAADRGEFPRRPSNWPSVPAKSDAAAWKADVALLDLQHVLLRDVVRRLPPSRLGQRSAKGTWTLGEMIHGVAAHDLYHTGQIQLLKRLMSGR